MSRIRTIKPGFFTSEDLAELPLSAERTWVGLWTQCDDHGRTKDNVKLIKAAVWPLRPHSLADVEADLAALADAGRIVRYRADDGKPYLAVVNWHVHQSINKPTRPRYPAPPAPVNPVDPEVPGYCAVCSGHQTGGVSASSVSGTGELPEDSGSAPGGLPLGKEGKGKEGKGGGTRDARVSGTAPGASGPGSEPPLKCSRHINDPEPPPCPACADARRTRQAWDRVQADQAKSTPTPTPHAPPCPLHPEGPGTAARCPDCEAEAVPAPSLRVIRAGQPTREAS